MHCLFTNLYMPYRPHLEFAYGALAWIRGLLQTTPGKPAHNLSKRKAIQTWWTLNSWCYLIGKTVHHWRGCSEVTYRWDSLGRLSCSQWNKICHRSSGTAFPWSHGRKMPICRPKQTNYSSCDFRLLHGYFLFHVAIPRKIKTATLVLYSQTVRLSSYKGLT